MSEADDIEAASPERCAKPKPEPPICARLAEDQIIDAIDEQFDIHAMEPEDWAELSCAITKALSDFAAALRAGQP